MNISELKKALNNLKLDDDTEILISAPDCGEPYAVSYIGEDDYVSSYEKKAKPVQVLMIYPSV